MKKKTIVLLLLLNIFLNTGIFSGTVTKEILYLEKLAKTWGILKYFHPNIAKGEVNWDQALIQVIEEVKKAQDNSAFNSAIDKLIDLAGAPRFLDLDFIDSGNES